jgi:DHA1 family tetracycline resistance protein-like MFS transporter
LTESASSQSRLSQLRPRRAATIFIFITIVLDVLAIGMVIPVLPALIGQVGHVSGAKLYTIVGLFGTVWATMQLIAQPVQGALSDRFGRRPVILLSNLGMGFNYLMMAVAPSLAWLWVGRIISGLCAGSIPAAMAYMADVNPPEKRAASFGLLFAGLNLGFALGPVLGGVFSTMSPRAPFWAAAVLSLLNFTYGAFVLPESLPRERRAPLEFWRLNPIGALYGMLKSHPGLIGLLTVSFLLTLAQMGPNNVFVLYTHDVFGWSSLDVSLLMSASAIAGVGIQMGIVPFVIRAFGERTAVLAGGCLQVAGLTIFGLATTGGQFWLAVPLVALAGIAGPAWSAMMSRSVEADEQGRLAGATSSLNSLSMMLAPFLFTQVFREAMSTSSHLPRGAPYFMAAAIMVVGLALAAFVTSRTSRRRTVGEPRAAMPPVH